MITRWLLRPNFIHLIGKASVLLFFSGVGLGLLFGLSSCNGLIKGKLFKERSAEIPPPSEERIEKSFFVDPSGQPKTFLCAWSPEMGRGAMGEYVGILVNESMHCNIEFEVTERYLVGKIIHPSFLNDRNRWKQALRIPIVKHYYYERGRDSYGRETNEWIENSSRSHWSARPMMTLDLSAMEILEFLWGGPHRITNVEDIEWDRSKNFLGFSINTVSSLLGSELQAKIRVNFLQFEHDPTFKKIPYHQENSKYFNILHVMGKRIEGIEPELYVGHWDLRKPIKIYINGFPQQHEGTIIRALNTWNQSLQNVGAIPKGTNFFEPVIANLKHPFDLRYPSITWVSDQRISLNSPLGIGMAHADVRNGKILWGGVVVYGGMLEKYINAYTPNGMSNENESNFQTISVKERVLPIDEKALLVPQSLPTMPAVQGVDFNLKSQMIDALKRHLKKDREQDVEKEDFRSFEKIVMTLIEKSKEESAFNQQFFKRYDLLSQLGFQSQSPIHFQLQSRYSSLSSLLKANEKTNFSLFSKYDGDRGREHDSKQKWKSLYQSSRMNQSYFVENERTVENLLGSWSQSEARLHRSYSEILDAVVMQISVHEIGHLLGLGHQFKENILPKSGTVPSRYFKALKSRANREAGFTNMSSIMGYPNGRTEMILLLEEIKPEIQDELVLHYLYKGEYSVFDDKKDDFQFVSVPINGKIPQTTSVQQGGQQKKLEVSYFPSCNDIEASLGADPFCNRFDRGSTAEDIVSSYFSGISDNLAANLYSLVGGSGNTEYAEARLWGMALDTFSRVRLFYDEMRRRLRSDERLRPLWHQLRSDTEALFEFSYACNTSDPTSEKQVRSKTLRKIFADPEIVDLCRANQLALKEFRFFVNLPEGDYTRIDHKNRYVSGGYLEGDVVNDWGHIFGSWYQLTNLPLKISALHTLTTANPYLMIGGNYIFNPYYHHEDDRYLYRSLYPKEYTILVADTVKNNLRFASNEGDDITTMGRSVISAGLMVPTQADMSNDSQKLPSGYNETLNQQTQFRLSMVAINIKAATPEATSAVAPNHYQKFTATIFDYFTGKSTTARDVFILPQGNVFVRAIGMFLYPITKMKFYSETEAYVVAYKVDYDQEVEDKLMSDSVKTALTELHEKITNSCVEGVANSGLASYFSSASGKFKGFDIPPNIATESGKEAIARFYQSIEEEFKTYEEEVRNNKLVPPHLSHKGMRAVCDESIRGVGQILSAAALINGYWLKITTEFLVK